MDYPGKRNCNCGGSHDLHNIFLLRQPVIDNAVKHKHMAQIQLQRKAAHCFQPPDFLMQKCAALHHQIRPDQPRKQTAADFFFQRRDHGIACQLRFDDKIHSDRQCQKL